jgi:hypothetical protein
LVLCGEPIGLWDAQRKGCVAHVYQVGIEGDRATGVLLDVIVAERPDAAVCSSTGHSGLYDHRCFYGSYPGRAKPGPIEVAENL